MQKPNPPLPGAPDDERSAASAPSSVRDQSGPPAPGVGPALTGTPGVGPALASLPANAPPLPGAPAIDLPRLDVVDADALVLHEDTDERRVGVLAHKLQVDGVMKNPPIVAPMPDGRFVVLDGANRTSALRQLGVPHAVVQIVTYAEVRLTTWFHLVTGMPSGDLLAAVDAIPELHLVPSTLDEARAQLLGRSSLAFLVMPDDVVFGLCPRPSSAAHAAQDAADGGGIGLPMQASLLRQVVATYRGQATIQRIQTDNMAALRPIYPEIAALVVFPPYCPADILALAGQSLKLPTGITRHVIPRRALRTNTDLDFLWSEAPRHEKRRWLSEWTRHKLQARDIRYYEESTFLYDE